MYACAGTAGVFVYFDTADGISDKICPCILYTKERVTESHMRNVFAQENMPHVSQKVICVIKIRSGIHASAAARWQKVNVNSQCEYASEAAKWQKVNVRIRRLT